MQSFATTVLQSASSIEYPFSIKVSVNSKGVRKVEVVEEARTGPRPFMLLDLLAQIMPQKLYIYNINVEYGMNPVLHPSPGYYGHPCLIVRQGLSEKRYRLDQVVSTSWFFSMPAVHLRAMVVWWRENRSQIDLTPHDWGVWAIPEA